MLNAKNNHLLAEKLSSYNEKVVRQIIGFNYYVDTDDDYNVSNLEICFVLEPNTDRGRLKVLVKFSDVTGVRLNGIGKIIYLTGFEIIDNKKNGWDSGQRYYVHDYEDNKFEFYCRTIEILSVEQI